MKTSEEIRNDFLAFWSESPRNAKIVPNMSLVPNVDSTLLFVNSGMFPLAPYLGGLPHPMGKRLVNIQRCLRTNYDDLMEIGDNRHTSMFEMIGNWSLGDFFKKEQINWIMEFWIEKCNLDPSRLYVSVFEGDADAPRDIEAIQIWQEAFLKYGITAKFCEDISNLPKNLEEGKNWEYRIFPFPKKKNWWERAHAPSELGGPTSEMFYDLGSVRVEQGKYNINDDSGRFIEIGNNVFMQNVLDTNLKWQMLPQKNIDFGGGFERVVMIVQGKDDIFETDLYMPIIQKVGELSGKTYKTKGEENEFTSAFRIIADHARASTFILADGVMPSNKDQGYILRRFIRRLIRFGIKLEINNNFSKIIAETVIERMQNAYPHLLEQKATVLEAIDKEENAFRLTLVKGLKFLRAVVETQNDKKQIPQNVETQNFASPHQQIASPQQIPSLQQIESAISGATAYNIYETYGFPLEMIIEELKITDENQIKKIEAEFKAEEQKHREASRAGSEQKFKGGLADNSIETTKLHTAHHLLLAALQKIVDSNIKQRGSNITAERLRIDFNLDRKLTEDEIKKVEELVNQKINEGLNVKRLEMPKAEAEKLGAQMEFGQKYGEIVTIYRIGDEKDPFSMEFCGGPHVGNTSELANGGKRFKIFKEESSGGGIRRIKAGLI